MIEVNFALSRVLSEQRKLALVGWQKGVTVDGTTARELIIPVLCNLFCYTLCLGVLGENRPVL